MSTRVIAGKAKGTRLKLVPGDTTRPIMDRVKEALFGIIGMDILDTHFLDLFAGTGSVGIEALSRGAAYCLFCDLERNAIQTITENLTVTRFTERAEVRRADAFTVLAGAPPRAFDYVYIAPPQYKNLWARALAAIEANPAWLTPQPTVIVQIDPEERTEVALQHLRLADERKYGNTLLLFYDVYSPPVSSAP